MIAQIYVDDIVFGGMLNQMVQHFVYQMQSEFEMSLVGELSYFLVYKSNRWKTQYSFLRASMLIIL